MSHTKMYNHRFPSPSQQFLIRYLLFHSHPCLGGFPYARKVNIGFVNCPTADHLSVFLSAATEMCWETYVMT